MVHTWDYMHDQAREQAAALPIEGVLALLEFMTAMSLAPWNFADPQQGNMPTAAFGDGRGLVTVLILDGRRELFVTKVQWIG